MCDRPAYLTGAVRVPDTQHLIPGGEGSIPWEWTGPGQQTVRCERKGCCGQWTRTIDPVTLSAGIASYVGGEDVGITGPPPCPDKGIPF